MKQIKHGNWRYLKNNTTLIHTDNEGDEYEVDLDLYSEADWSNHLQETRAWANRECIQDFFACLDDIKVNAPWLPIFANVPSMKVLASLTLSTAGCRNIRDYPEWQIILNKFSQPKGDNGDDI
jgi:hypothetical protein